jgi:hypothetical protein
MDFKMEHSFDCPVGKITPILAAGEDLVPMEDLPNVSQRKVIERKREGTKLHSKLEWCVHGQIPKIAQKLIDPDKLTFLEQTVWDDETATFTTRIIPHFLKDKFDCRTTSAWSAIDANRAKRTFSGKLEIKIPIIGSIVEKTIIDYLKKNNDKNAVMVTKALLERFGPPKK